MPRGATFRSLGPGISGESSVCFVCALLLWPRHFFLQSAMALCACYGQRLVSVLLGGQSGCRGLESDQAFASDESH